MKPRWILPGLVVLVFLIAACAPVPELRNDKFLHDSSLVTDEPCSAPCWRGITPGETSWSDALVILEDDSTLDDPETQTVDESAAVAAQWRERDGELCCQMLAEDGETVSVIFLQLAPDNTVGQLIETQGDPAYVVGTPLSDDQALVYFLYPEKDIMVLVFVAGAATGKVSASSEIVGVWYLTPDAMDLALKTNNLHAWEGYSDFSTYTIDADVSQFEVTPSVTLTPTPEG
ncbi:MAG: hypothetical protein H6672_19675 [Anaerolineaceae bacterium]|nr:hypothetical protein [Anaerolineaceae bacterium]